MKPAKTDLAEKEAVVEMEPASAQADQLAAVVEELEKETGLEAVENQATMAATQPTATTARAASTATNHQTTATAAKAINI